MVIRTYTNIISGLTFSEEEVKEDFKNQHDVGCWEEFIKDLIPGELITSDL